MKLGDAISAVVLEYGNDYKFTDDCEYRRSDGAPACLLGHALDRMGILPSLEELERNDLNEERLGELLSFVDPEHEAVSEEEIVAGESAQMNQDLGETWGRAANQYTVMLDAMEG